MDFKTDAPDFAVDEPKGELGTAFELPIFLQPHQEAIETALPELA